MTMRMTVFNVERGLCVYVQSPTGYAMFIDCGSSGQFSPAAWFKKHESPNVTAWKGKTLTKLVVTHPHDDHVEDINNVKNLAPFFIFRQNDYRWSEILNPPDGEPSENLTSYYNWQKDTFKPIPSNEVEPDWGMEIQHFFLSPTEAEHFSGANQNLVNNSSIVTVLTRTAPKGSWKVVVAGDNETEGWSKLLKKTGFKNAVNGADLYVTAHHGHNSGFSDELFEAMGKPLLNITSEKTGDESIFDYGENYARGVSLDGETRYHLTTRAEGHITLWLKPDLQCTYAFGDLQ